MRDLGDGEDREHERERAEPSSQSRPGTSSCTMRASSRKNASDAAAAVTTRPHHDRTAPRIVLDQPLRGSPGADKAAGSTMGKSLPIGRSSPRPRPRSRPRRRSRRFEEGSRHGSLVAWDHSRFGEREAQDFDRAHLPPVIEISCAGFAFLQRLHFGGQEGFYL